MARQTGTPTPIRIGRQRPAFALDAPRRRPCTLALAAATLAFATAAGQASAAPQVLGVIASIAPVEMSCTADTCTAQLSAFCLQREREVPVEHTGYRPADPTAFRIVATRSDGTMARVPLDARASFTSAFGYASVRVAVPSALVAELGAASLAIDVAPAAALVPVPVAGDPDPLGEAEIALATGPLRALASRHFDAPSTARDAAHLIEAVVNGFPVQSWEGLVDRAGLWDRQVTPDLSAAASPDAFALARSIYENCLPSSYSMRQCLELKHMNLLSDANRAYWDEASPGS
jgi:hypothetical protein